MTHPVVADVTRAIAERSAATRGAYLDRVRAAAEQGPARGGLGCANLAHGFAASGADKERSSGARQAERRDRVQLQRHALRPPAVRRLPRADQGGRLRDAGGIAQFAGGVPAMCDGITQGRAGMELSLYSRDVIAMADRDRALARHVRRRADARRLRQDRAGPR